MKIHVAPMLTTVLAWTATASTTDALGSVPPTNCSTAMNNYCNSATLSTCIDVIKKEGGSTPLVALFDVSQHNSKPAWRCYSPSALNANHTAYNTSSGSGLYCTEPELDDILDKCLHPPPPVKLVLLEDAAETLGAVCLDGSPPAVYVRLGAESEKWHVHMEGGGWCFHDPPTLMEDNQCHYRAYSDIPIESRTPPRYLGSSAMLAANYSTVSALVKQNSLLNSLVCAINYVRCFVGTSTWPGVVALSIQQCPNQPSYVQLELCLYSLLRWCFVHR